MAEGEAKVRAVAPGTVVDGKYVVEGVIGQGGLATVFMARHVELGSRVAIKVLHDEWVDDPELVARFSREARAAVRLRTEHVVKVFDVGTLRSGPRRTPYMVLELLAGEDLERIVARGALPVAEAVDCILQVCEAVAEAHKLGLVHRDLKLNNLFVVRRPGDDRPFVKVLDFGFVKHLGVLDDKTGLTETSSVFGSPHYMSPEQIRASRDVDARSDIWALGACLYELLSGATPFTGETFFEIAAAVLKQEPTPLSLHAPSLPPGLWPVVARCLEKDPAARFRDVSELARALEPFAEPGARNAARIEHVLRAPEGRESAVVTVPQRVALGLAGAAAIGALVAVAIVTRSSAAGSATEASPRVLEHDPVPLVLADVAPPDTSSSIAGDRSDRPVDPPTSRHPAIAKPSGAPAASVRQAPQLKLGPAERL